MRPPGYETLDRAGPSPYPYRHYADMRRPQYITTQLANGWHRQTLVDADQLPARSGGDMESQLHMLANSGNPALALRARQLELLRLAG
jgi:hypothetical protein